MTDEELLAQSANCPIMYLDGLGHFQKVNGVLRFVGWVYGVGAQMNFAVSLAGVDQANREIRRILDEAPTPSIKIWNGTRLAH
jgi:hypothetical protein